MPSWDPTAYATNARFVTDLGAPVLDLLDPRAGERVLDLGCGDGVLTLLIAERGADVVGVDSSEEMVESARERGVEAYVLDGHELPFSAEFDAVFSNAALHWMTKPDAVIGSVARTLKPGGRFVGEMGGHGCVAAVTTALIASLGRRGIDGAALIPWYFPTADDYSARLEGQGFDVTTMQLFPRPTALPGDVHGWLDTFAGVFLTAVDDGGRQAVMKEVADLLRPSLCDERGRWTVDYVRLRFAAKLRG